MNDHEMCVFRFVSVDGNYFLYLCLKSFQKVLRQLRKTILQNKPQHSSQTQGNTKGEYETLQVKGIKVMREKE